MKKLIAFFIFCLIFVNFVQAQEDCGKNDRACWQRNADLIEADVLNMNHHDRRLVRWIQKAVIAYDEETLAFTKYQMEHHRDWKLEDPQQHALWYEIVYVGMMYLATPHCHERGGWFMFYSASWQPWDKECLQELRTMIEETLSPRQWESFYAGGMVSCKLPFNEEAALLFEMAQSYILTSVNAHKFLCE